MMKFFQVLFFGAIIFAVLILFVVLIGVGLNYLLEYIPCELLLYVETGLLFIIVILIALILDKK